MAKYEPLSISDEELTRLDAEHDDVMKFAGDKELAPWLCVVRRPTTEEAAAYVAMANDPQKKTFAITKLVTAISVFPKKESDEWKRQYSRWPMFPFGLAKNDRFEKFCGLEGVLDAREK
jgi:hypothetical protein